MTESPILSVRGVSKRFGQVVANDELDLQFYGGRIHGLLGENGAGKSTVIKLLGGIYRPDAGQIVVGNNAVAIESPFDASQLGIEIVHQESILIPALTIAENIALRRKIKGRIGGTLLAEFSAVTDSLGFELDPQAKVTEISIGARQRADIVIAMMGKPRVLILDEPTPFMGPDEREAFFALIRRLADEGAAVVLVTHRLREATEHCDDVSVLRNGQNASCWIGSNLPGESEMLEAMVGERSPMQLAGARQRTPKREGTAALASRAVRLKVSDRLTVTVDQLDVWPGEIVGVAGIEGSGQRELAGLFVGQLTPDTGEVRILGDMVSSYSQRHLCSIVGDVPDEPTLGTAGDLSIWENLAFPTLLWESVGRARRRRLRSSAQESIDRFRVKAPDGNTPVSHLSGGNKRRVVLARETHVKSPKVLVLTYATRGLDVRAGEGLLRHVQDLADGGTAVVFISSDLDELLLVCDRVSVVVDGHLAGAVNTSELDQLTLASSMLGLGVAEPTLKGGAA